MKKLLIFLIAILLSVPLMSQNEYKYVVYMYGGWRVGPENRISFMAQIDSAKIESLRLVHYVGGVAYPSNATHTGDVTGSVALTIATGAVDRGHTSITETPDGTKFLRDDWSWQTPGGGGIGDVVGPASAVDDRVVTFNATTGKVIQDGGNTIPELLARANHTGTQLANTISNFDASVSGNSAVSANTAKTSNATHTGEVTGSGALTVADGVIDPDNLDADNSPSDNYIPSFDLASGQFHWVANAAGGGGDMSYSDTASMLAPYPTFTEMRGEISDTVDALLAAGEPGLAIADTAAMLAPYLASADEQDLVTLAGTYDYLTLVGQVLTRGQIDLATDVTGVLPDANVANDITASNYEPLLTNSAGLASALSDETGTGVSVFGTSPTITTGMTVNGTVTATGNISGAMATTLYTAATEALTAQECRNQGHVNNDADAIDFTLPAAEAGLVVLFLDFAGGVITIDAAAGDIITLDGTALDAGDAIDSPGDVGDFIALWCLDGTNWVSMGRSGTWVDGGTD